MRDLPILRALRRLRRGCWKLAVWFIIGSAVLVSIGRLVAPYADSFRPVVERFLAEVLERPVRIERIEARWPRLSPQITLIGLEVGRPGEPLLDVDRARLQFKLYNLVRPGRNSFELVVLGLNMLLVQDDEGRWSWRLDRGGTFAEGWEQAVSAGDVLLRDGGIRISPRGLPDLRLAVPEANLSRVADRLQVRLDAIPDGGSGERLEVRLVLHMPRSRLESLAGYASASSIGLSSMALESTAESVIDLRAQMQWWVNWNRSDGAQLHGEVDLHSLAEGGIAGRMSSHFQLDGTWRQEELALELNAREFGDGKAVLIQGLAYGSGNGRHGVVAERIELEYLHALLQPWMGFAQDWPASVSGTVSNLRLGATDSGSLYLAEGRVEGLDVDIAERGFSASLERVDLALAGDRLLMRPSGPAIVGLPALYPQPLAFTELSGAIALGGTRMETRSLALEHPEFHLVADGAIELAGETPFLDLVLDMPRLSTQSPRRWLPQRGLGPNTRKWLNEALLEVGSAQAVTTLFGEPADWKNYVPPGSVNSRADFSGLRLAYAKNWPVAEDVSGQVEFSGESMTAVAESGQVEGVTLQAPLVHISEARNAEIELHLEAVDAGADGLARLASALPLAGVEGALARLRWQGGASASASVWFPVKRKDDWRLVGVIDFAEAGVELREQRIALDRISGELPFTRERLGPARLAAEMLGEPVIAALDSWFRPEFRLSLQGTFPVRGLIPEGWKGGLSAVVEKIEGRAPFDIAFESGESTGDARNLELRMTSSLEGVSSGLPAPLDKPGGAVWPFEMTLPLGDAQQPVRFGIQELFTGEWLMSTDYWQLGLGLGGATVELPAAENFIVEGSLPALDVDQWLGLIAETTSNGREVRPNDRGIGLSGWVDLTVEDLRVQKASLGTVALSLIREENYWRLTGQGEQVAGSIRFPASGIADRSIVADMTRLAWPASQRDEPMPAGEPSSVDPARLPALDLVVRDLQWGELDLGEFRLNSHREDRGLQIEQVSSRRDGLELTGSGEWLRGADGPFSRMRIRLAAADLGQTLDQAGFDLALQRGQAVVELQGRWPGSPLDLSLPRIDGGLDLVITDGVIPEASPGAGRLLGLVSLNSIPRRLRLDFSDVFGEGLSFDRVAGHFDLADGVAATEDMRIDAPAAEVLMRGRTDLENRTYDQTLIVRPGVGSALPVIGALAGGPVGAAAGAALQQIFSKPLSGISEVRYSVTGDWKQPVIEPVAVEPAERGDG